MKQGSYVFSVWIFREKARATYEHFQALLAQSMDRIHLRGKNGGRVPPVV